MTNTNKLTAETAETIHYTISEIAGPDHAHGIAHGCTTDVQVLDYARDVAHDRIAQGYGHGGDYEIAVDGRLLGYARVSSHGRNANVIAEAVRS